MELNMNKVKDQSIESELNLAINESKNQSLLQLLKESLKDGSLPGEIGDLNNFNYLKTEAIEAAVAQASQFEYASNRLVEDTT